MKAAIFAPNAFKKQAKARYHVIPLCCNFVSVNNLKCALRIEMSASGGMLFFLWSCAFIGLTLLAEVGNLCAARPTKPYLFTSKHFKNYGT